MKFYLAFVVAVIGVGMVAADENLKSKLQMALKSMLNETPQGEKKDLEIETRDSMDRCISDTGNCNGHGICQKRSGWYICVCYRGYIRNGNGGCSRMTTSEIEYLDMLARDEQMEMLVGKYVSFSQCSRETNDCNEGGECVEEDGRYWCVCREGYEKNEDGGCSRMTTREIEYLDMLARDEQMEMLVGKYVSFPQCTRETNDCNEGGECVEEDGEYWCVCGGGYEENEDGGCSRMTTREIEYLDMLARDEQMEMLVGKYVSFPQCTRETNDCNEGGECVEKDGEYWCVCGEGYEENKNGGCSPIEKREQVETLARKSFSECTRDTNDCDGYGECVEEYEDYICKCFEGYEENVNGGCSLIAKRATEVDDDDFTERKKEIMRQLAEFLQEE